MPSPTPTPLGRTAALLLTLLLSAPAAWSQNQASPPSAGSLPGEVVEELSPFEVQSSDNDVGYYAENTLAGSRMNTRISDLAASITVVTRQQMDDTASLDLNDVFRYELNTEGSSSYTPSVQSLRNDGVVDTIAGFTHGGAGSPQTVSTANRIRGIGSPDRTINYYLSISQVPLDAYNVSSLEINRGPNSMIFGLGSPAGIVNTNLSSALLDHNSMSVGLRVDDRGSFRSSFSFNKALGDQLAVYGAFLYNDQQYVRKPSHDITGRQYGSITFKPWEKTRLRFSIENYENDNRRPNNLTPRDGVTPWRNAGRPAYDPSTLRVTLLDTGQVVGPFVMNAASPRAADIRSYIMSRPGYNPALWNSSQTTYAGFTIFGEGVLTNTASSLYIPGIVWTNNGRPTMQIADGQAQAWFSGFNGQYRYVFGTPTDPAANAPLNPPTSAIYGNPASDQVYNQRWTTSALWGAPTNVGSYRYPGVTDKSIYDWEEVNVNEMNFGEDKNLTMNLELEQEIIPGLLHFNAGWFRQDFDSVTNYTVAQLNVTTLFVDTNTKYPDGTPNPYFGLPYVEDFDPDQFVNADLNDHYRAMLAFTPDFTKSDGWTRWLGSHQAIGLLSRFDSMHSFYRKRWFFTGGDEVANQTIRWLKNPNNSAAGAPTGYNFENTSIRRTYYLANPGDPQATVTRGSGRWDNASFTGGIRTYNYDLNRWEDVAMTQQFLDHSAGTGRNQRRVDTYKAGITSYFWNDRLVTTFGFSHDEYKARATTTGAITNPDGTVTPALTNPEKWVDGVYQTDLVFNRWNVYDELSGTTTTAGGVLTPFRNWKNIDASANDGNQFAQFMSDLGFHYNQSDNFNPPSAAQVDAFGEPLPKPTGQGKDYGFQFTLLDKKLYARFTWFEATNENERTNPGTSISRLTTNVDTTLFRNYARTIALINMGRNPTTENWDTVAAADEPAVQAAAEQIWGQSYTYYDDLPGAIYATRSAEAEGTEIQVVYNPIQNWTLKFTGSKQQTSYSDVLKEFDAWYAQRAPVWDTATAAKFLLPQYQQYATYTAFSGREVDLTTFWGSYGYRSEIRLDEPNGYYNAQLYYDGVVTPQYAIASDLEGQVAPGQREYRWSVLTNYAFAAGRLQGFSVGGNLRWEDESVIGYYGKPNPGSGSSALALSDTTKPIYDEANYYTDLWVGYTRRIMNDKVRMKLQLNIANVFEDGYLQPVGVNYDGSINAYRIIDPRQFILTASFDL